jgi:hypothetical protein
VEFLEALMTSLVLAVLKGGEVVIHRVRLIEVSTDSPSQRVRTRTRDVLPNKPLSDPGGGGEGILTK